MASILNSAMLDSDTAILDSDTLLSSLRFTQIHSHSTLTLNQTNSIWLKLIHSHFTWWWQPSWMAILDSAILVFSFKLTHTCQDFFLPFAQKTSLIHSNSTLMMAAILNSVMLDWETAILDSDTLLSSLRFTQKHSHSTLTLTQTNSIWFKLFHFHLPWWWWPSWILAILDSAILVFPFKFTHTCQDWFPPLAQKNFTHSFWFNLMMAAILNTAILNLAISDSAILVFSFKLNHTCQD